MESTKNHSPQLFTVQLAKVSSQDLSEEIDTQYEVSESAFTGELKTPFNEVTSTSDAPILFKTLPSELSESSEEHQSRFISLDTL